MKINWSCKDDDAFGSVRIAKSGSLNVLSNYVRSAHADAADDGVDVSGHEVLIRVPTEEEVSNA